MTISGSCQHIELATISTGTLHQLCILERSKNDNFAYKCKYYVNNKRTDCVMRHPVFYSLPVIIDDGAALADPLLVECRSSAVT